MQHYPQYLVIWVVLWQVPELKVYAFTTLKIIQIWSCIHDSEDLCKPLDIDEDDHYIA
jgi:hypothetical protein